MVTEAAWHFSQRCRMLVSFLTVSPGKHDSCLPPIPEPKPEQGFPVSRQADQGHWAGTLQRFSGKSPRPSGGVPIRWRMQRQLDFNTMTPNECSFAPGKLCSDFSPRCVLGTGYTAIPRTVTSSTTERGSLPFEGGLMGNESDNNSDRL